MTGRLSFVQAVHKALSVSAQTEVQLNASKEPDEHAKLDTDKVLQYLSDSHMSNAMSLRIDVNRSSLASMASLL